MTHETARELVRVVNEAATRLRAIDEAAASSRTQPGAWSTKEIVGHLIDSAANNHQRFVRAQGEGELALPAYEQNAWVQRQGYQERPWSDLVDLWALYNRHLSHVIERIPDAALETTCRIGAGQPVTLGYLVEDYLVHLRHHLAQIDARHAA
jgi:hypothetical protein